MTDSEDLVGKAEQVKAGFTREATDIYAGGFAKNVELAYLADAWLKAEGQLTDLREAHGRAQAGEQTAAQRRVFGADDLRQSGSDPATHIVSFRDAQDRAEAADGSDRLLTLMRRALGSGDMLLARACAARAVQRGWTDVVTAYEDVQPGFAELASRVREDRQAASLARAIRFGLRKPPELARFSPDDMVRLRREALEPLSARARRRVG
jgi:hypothetical protein